jgi:hypothetical protein
MSDALAGPRRQTGTGSDSAFTGEPWCVVRTASRCEKIVARQFAARGIAHYLPLQRVSRQYASITCDVELAVIPGFVFARGSIAALRGAGLASLVRTVHLVEDQSAFCGQMQQLSQQLVHDSAQAIAPADQGPQLDSSDSRIKGLEGLIATLNQACGLGIGSGKPVLDS